MAHRFARAAGLLAVAWVCGASDCGGDVRSYEVNVVRDGTSGTETTWVEAVIEDSPGWSGGPSYRERVRVALRECVATLVSRTGETDAGVPDGLPTLRVTDARIAGPGFDVERCPGVTPVPTDADVASVSCASADGARWLVLTPSCTDPTALGTVSAAWLDASGARARPDREVGDILLGRSDLRCEVADSGRAVVYNARAIARSFEIDPATGARPVDAGGTVHDVAVRSDGWAWVRARPTAPTCASAETRVWGGGATASIDLTCTDPPWDPAAGLVATRDTGFTVVYPLHEFHARTSNAVDLDSTGAVRCRGTIDWASFVPPR